MPLRVHLLDSDFHDLNALQSDEDVHALIGEVNRVWDQARIVWQVEDVVRPRAENESEFLRLQEGEPVDPYTVLPTIVPRDRLLENRWNVVFVRDLSSFAPGVYLLDVAIVVVSELNPEGISPGGAAGRILAHELGHSLGLQHVACTVEGNLMAPSCFGLDRTHLTSAQIAASRLQAATGRPFTYTF